MLRNGASRQQEFQETVWMEIKMRQVTSFWFKITSAEDPDGITDDIDSEINNWAQKNRANIVSTSMAVDPVKNVLYVVVVWE
jgi:hypothetical protein